MGYSPTISSMVKDFLLDREVPFVVGKDNFYVSYDHVQKRWVTCIDRYNQNPFQIYVRESAIDSLKTKFGFALKQILSEN